MNFGGVRVHTESIHVFLLNHEFRRSKRAVWLMPLIKINKNMLIVGSIQAQESSFS